MYDESEMRIDPDKWMSPEQVSLLWKAVGYRNKSRVTVGVMMQKGWFEDHGVKTELFDEDKYRVLRDDLLKAMLHDLSGVVKRLAEECAARGIDVDLTVAERAEEGTE